MNNQTTDQIKLKISGGHMYLTSDPEEVFFVEHGIVNVYVVKTVHGVLGRSLFLCEMQPGQWIPTLSLAEREESSYWQLLLMAQDTAELTVHMKSDIPKDIEEIRADFLKQIPKLPESTQRFSVQLAEYYESILQRENQTISGTVREKEEIRKGRTNLILALFQKKKPWEYEEKTDSPLYNVMKVCCDYMNIRICSYQTIQSICGADFDIADIARISHFIVRDVTLEGKWYEQDGGPVIAFRRDTHQPVLCVPKGINRYLMYDIESSTDFLVDAKEAATLCMDALMVYRPFPGRALKFRDVMQHGIRTLHGRDIAAFVMMTFLGVLVGLLIPFLNEMMFDRLIPMGDMGAISQVGYVIFACAVGNVFFLLVKNLSMLRATKSVEYTIVGATFDRLFHLPQNYLEQFGSMDLVNRVLSVASVFQAMSTGLITAVLGFIFSVFYVVKMFRQSSALAGRGLVMVLITVAVTVLLGSQCLRYERKKLETGTKANVLLYQFIAGIRKVKVSGIEDRALLEYQKYNTETVKNDIKSAGISNYATVFSGMMSMVYSGVIYYVVIHKDITITVGEYTAFSSAFGLFTSSVMQLANYFLTMGLVIPAYKRAKPIFMQPTELSDDIGAIAKFEGKIEVDNLVFSYDPNAERKVLNEVSFQAKPGEYLGIVGTSGSGKSTLLKCLLGFEKPLRGKIYYDNRDIDEMDKRELRKQIGVVLQNGHLMEGSIYSNVAIAAPRISLEEVGALMKEVGMSDDVSRMPMGIMTEISERGTTISGGQQQRILLARALANHPSILFLDEATSALDNITQTEICKNLENRKITRVVIAHRLSTVEKCDRILVLNNGCIEEQGSYEELMEKQGLFYTLAKRQQIGEDFE